MARLVKKEVGDQDGGAVYLATFEGRPTPEELRKAQDLPIEHECFSGKVEHKPGLDEIEEIKDEALKDGYTKFIIGQAC
jgi:hypothetical protein